jgi:hypothetical protein
LGIGRGFNENNKNKKTEVAGTLLRMQGLDPRRKLTLLKPEGIRRVGKPQLSWLESFAGDLKNMDVRNWRRKYKDREQWRTILEEAKVSSRTVMQ